jgi:hypothetical protein
MSRSGVTSRSALPHSGPSRLGGHSRLRKPTSTSIRAISNFGTSKSRTCARLGCLRIERWAREGIARANVAFPPIATSTVAIANGSFTSVRDVAQSYQMRGFRPFGDRDAMARMRKYRSFPNGAANGSIRPFPRVPFGPATEGMRQKAAQGATGAVRQERTFPALSPSR